MVGTSIIQSVLDADEAGPRTTAQAAKYLGKTKTRIVLSLKKAGILTTTKSYGYNERHIDLFDHDELTKVKLCLNTVRHLMADGIAPLADGKIWIIRKTWAEVSDKPGYAIVDVASGGKLFRLYKASEKTKLPLSMLLAAINDWELLTRVCAFLKTDRKQLAGKLAGKDVLRKVCDKLQIREGRLANAISTGGLEPIYVYGNNLTCVGDFQLQEFKRRINSTEAIDKKALGRVVDLCKLPQVNVEIRTREAVEVAQCARLGKDLGIIEAKTIREVVSGAVRNGAATKPTEKNRYQEYFCIEEFLQQWKRYPEQLREIKRFVAIGQTIESTVLNAKLREMGVMGAPRLNGKGKTKSVTWERRQRLLRDAAIVTNGRSPDGKVLYIRKASNGSIKARTRNNLNEVTAFLREQLANGPALATTVTREARKREKRISRPTLRKAFTKLGCNEKSFAAGQGCGAYAVWSLPAQTPPTKEVAIQLIEANSKVKDEQKIATTPPADEPEAVAGTKSAKKKRGRGIDKKNIPLYEACHKVYLLVEAKEIKMRVAVNRILAEFGLNALGEGSADRPVTFDDHRSRLKYNARTWRKSPNFKEK